MQPLVGAVDRVLADATDINILVFGDSTTESYDEWTGDLASLLASEFATHSVAWEGYWNGGAEDWGETYSVSTGSGSNTIKLWVGAGGGWVLSDATAVGVIDHPSAVDYVICYIGLNGVTDSEWDTGLAAIQAEWPEAYITLVTQNSTAGAGYAPATAQQRTRDAGARWGLGVIDFEAIHLATSDPSSYLSDGTHPNEAGSELIADTVFEAFMSGGASMTVLSRAEAVYRASDYGGSGDWLDGSGNGHNGSITGAKFAGHFGTDYLWLPGTASNKVTTPSSANLAITSDLDVRARIWFDSLTFGGDTDFVTRYESGSLKSYRFGVSSAGYLRLVWSTDGSTTSADRTSTALLSSVADTDDPIWVRAALDVDNGASGYTLNFYTSTDGETWTRLGSEITTAGTTSVFNAAAVLEVGSWLNGGAGRLTGGVFNAQVLDGIDGLAVFDADFSDLASASATTFAESANSATVTLTRSSTGYVSSYIDEPMFLFSTDDKVTIADDDQLDFDTSDGFTVVARVRPTHIDGNLHDIVNKDAGAAGYRLYQSSTGQINFAVHDGTVNVADAIASTFTENVVSVVAGLRDPSANEVEAYADGSLSGSPTTDTTTATSANAIPLYIGVRNGNSAYYEGAVTGVALFREVLTETEITAAGEALADNAGRGWSHVASVGQELT